MGCTVAPELKQPGDDRRRPLLERVKASAGLVIALSLASPASAAPGPDEKPFAPRPALIGERPPAACKRFQPGKRVVKVDLKPNTDLGDLIAWISSITCKQFLLPGTIPANSKKVTVMAPELITPEEAYRLFLGALDSVGLTTEHAGAFDRIVETAKITSMGGVPVSDVPTSESYVTRFVRRESLSPAERDEIHWDIHNGPSPSPERFVLINEMARVIGDKDARACKPPPPGKPGVKLSLKPNVKVADLIAWIASVTCKQFLLPDTIAADWKKVTVV